MEKEEFWIISDIPGKCLVLDTSLIACDMKLRGKSPCSACMKSYMLNSQIPQKWIKQPSNLRLKSKDESVVELPSMREALSTILCTTETKIPRVQRVTSNPSQVRKMKKRLEVI